MNEFIQITLMLNSGIDKEIGLSDYDITKGHTLKIQKGLRLRTVLRKIKLKKYKRFVYFCQGERISVWHKIKSDEEISCIRPSGGG